jgi:TIR domain
MDDRELVRRLFELGVATFQKSHTSYADPSSDAHLHGVGAATIATWLEELGRHRLIGDVRPHFSRGGAGFRYQVTEEAVRIWSNPSVLERLLDQIVPVPPKYDVFISYTAGDSALATELKSDFEHQGWKCFMAEKDIPVAAEWQDTIRTALLGSQRILILLTTRSLDKPWVLMETGAAWVLEKELIPALVQVAPSSLIDPIRRYQARVIETTAQRKAFVQELTGT